MANTLLIILLIVLIIIVAGILIGLNQVRSWFDSILHEIEDLTGKITGDLTSKGFLDEQITTDKFVLLKRAANTSLGEYARQAIEYAETQGRNHQEFKECLHRTIPKLSDVESQKIMDNYYKITA